MTGVQEVLTVAHREFWERLRSKAFVISTVVTALVASVLLALPGLVDDRIDQVEVGVHPDAAGLAAALQEVAGEQDITVVVRSVRDASDIDAALADGDIDLVLRSDHEVIVETSFRQSSGHDLVTSAHRLLVLREAALVAGLDDAHLRDLLSSELSVRAIGVMGGGDEARASIATGGLILTYMAILMYGAWTLMGVTEEKSSRVVELILSTMRPRRLLAGKVLGIGILALGQMLVIAAALIGAGVWLGTIGGGSGAGVDLSAVPPDVIGILLLWFMAGFALYNAMFAAVGSLISRIEDAQSVNLPIALFVVASVAVSFFVLERPTSAIGEVATFIPFSAPFVAPVRYALGVLPAWQLIVALVITMAFTVVTVQVAGRIYQGAILRVGGKVPLRQAWRGVG